VTLVTSTGLAGVRPLGVENQQVVDNYRQLVSVIRSRLGRAHAELFTRPERQPGRGAIDWHTEFEGEIHRLIDLPPEQQATIEAAVAKKTVAVQALGAELGTGGRLFGEMLQRAVVLPGRDRIYLVGDQPVLVLWGFEPESDMPGYVPKLIAPPPTPLPTAEVAALGAGSYLWGDWWRWLLLLAMLALLALLALKACEPLPPTVVDRPEPPLDLSHDIAQAEKESARLAQELERLRTEREQQVAACTVLPEPIERVEQPAPAEIAQLPEVPALPPIEPIRPVAEVPKQKVKTSQLSFVPTPVPKHQSCFPQRKPFEAPEMVLVVDGSGSMAWPIAGAPTRLDAAKRSIGELVDGLPGDVDVGLIEFSDCNRVYRDNFYRPSERGILKQRVDGLMPRDGTPLGLSVERAGRIISSRRPGVIVVVSDGDDTCYGNPCGAAQWIAAQKPNVHINVIDISGSSGNPSAQCMAQATGGRIFKPNSVGEMKEMVQQASGEPDIRRCN
jgi:hypothetical protein